MSGLALADRAALLGIARAAILAHLRLAPAPALPREGSLAAPGGAFVTLHVNGTLRGCIGSFRTDTPLAEVVASVAVSAASADPRFPPLSPADVPGLDVSVSVLGRPRPVEGPPGRRTVRVGAEGLLVRRGLHRGTLLPKVAVEHGWGPEEFLKHACLKAGLHARAWEEPETEVEVFEAEEFAEGSE